MPCAGVRLDISSPGHRLLFEGLMNTKQESDGIHLEKVQCLNPEVTDHGTLVDASVCLYLDQLDPSAASNIEKIAHNYATGISNLKKKLTVPAALDWAVASSSLGEKEGTATTTPSMKQTKLLKGTHVPSLFTQQSVFQPSHENAVEYVLLNYLGNCAKSSHNHFSLDLPGQKGKESHHLLMVDNDRCFIENHVLEKANKDVNESGFDREHSERFYRWKKMLWTSCAWLGQGHDTSNGDSGSSTSVNSVFDIVERLKWHSQPNNPSLGTALRDALSEDILATNLLSTDKRVFHEIDVRVSDLLSFVDECEDQRLLREIHNPPSSSTRTEQEEASHNVNSIYGTPALRCSRAGAGVVKGDGKLEDGGLGSCSSKEPLFGYGESL